MSETHDASLGSIILHHVTNDLDYKFLDLHLLGYDISVTKHVIMLWIAAAITVSLAIYGTRRYRKSENAQPKGISHLYEILIDFIRDDIVISLIGLGGIILARHIVWKGTGMGIKFHLILLALKLIISSVIIGLFLINVEKHIWSLLILSGMINVITFHFIEAIATQKKLLHGESENV